jgi:hypothetical protein
MTNPNLQAVRDKAAAIAKSAEHMKIDEWLIAVETAVCSVIVQMYPKRQRQDVLDIMHKHMLDICNKDPRIITRN